MRPRGQPVLTLLWFVAAAFGTAAQAQDNPWCAFFSDGHTECGVATLQGCMAAIYSKTGFCDRKPQDVPPDASDASSANEATAHRDASQR
jgi:hypothetical protein